MKSLAPELRLSTSDSVSEVRTITGILDRSISLFISLSMSSPFIPGRFRSSRTRLRAPLFSRIALKASTPVSAQMIS